MGVHSDRETLYSLGDVLWSSIVASPLVLLYWRGTWELLDDVTGLNEVPSTEAVTNNESIKWHSGLGCHLIGLFFKILIDLTIHHVNEKVHYSKSKAFHRACSWVVTVVSGAADVAFWRGVWFLMRLDLKPGANPTVVAVVLVISLIILAGSGVERTLIASPCNISLDSSEPSLKSGTYFRKTPSDGWFFLLDILFSNLVIHHLVVFCWWSLWSLENTFFLGNDQIGVYERDLVSWDSVLLGYGLTLLAWSLDRFLPLTAKLYVAKPLSLLVTLTAFLASVNVWRGVWSFMDHWFLHNIPTGLNHIISHVMGLLLLSLLGIVNTISNRTIIRGEDGGRVVEVTYWKRKEVRSEEEDMVPIIE